jgi:predicted PolB exonuclease-like 3'-5' exonuclease
MDVLSSYQARARVSLQSAALLLGFPGKLGMSGDKVWDAYLDEQTDQIRNYCETDVVNTYLVFLRFQLMRGIFDSEQFRRECELVRSTLSRSTEVHWQQFLSQWQ